MRLLGCLLLMTTLAPVRAAETKPVIAATHEPTRFIAERLAGDFAEIRYPVPAGVDPEFWKPKDADIAAIQQADLILMNGATYEKWAITAALPYGRLVDTSLGFADKFITVENAITHSHGDQGEHSHGGTASITWLDLGQAALQAEAAGAALADAFPARAGSIEEKTAELTGELEKLHAAMREAAAPLRGTTVLASHPYFDYWARAYQVEVAALSWEADMELGEEEIAALRELREQHPRARLFLWDGEPSEANRAALEREGLTGVVVSPAANRPPAGDFLAVMKANVERLAAATKKVE